MTNLELARRAVACKRWRWVPGMLTDSGVRVFRVDDDGYVIGYGDHRYPVVREVPASALPDLTDPATLGCLLALVREAWGNNRLHCRPDGAMWRVWSDEPGAHIYATESAALVAALEAAP